MIHHGPALPGRDLPVKTGRFRIHRDFEKLILDRAVGIQIRSGIVVRIDFYVTDRLCHIRSPSFKMKVQMKLLLDG